MRVLLVASGYPFDADGNFGDTHLVSLGSYLQAHTSAQVSIIDLDYEQQIDVPAPERVFDPSFDVVGVSCYSSFDYLKSFYLSVEIRRRNPGAILVVGGYHPSARPQDFLGADSPFDHVVVGEGERPLARVVRAAARGDSVERVLGPDPVEELDSLPPLDWKLLDRYRPWAHRIGGQVTLALSRGCPFRCAFCMEGAKGSVGWRAYSPARAEQELVALHEWLDLTDWTVFFTDPVFGLRRAWRVEMLERLARNRLPVAKYWALGRADVLDLDDLALLHAAGFGMGFGLESGDAAMLRIIQKGGAGDEEAYLRRFEDLADRANSLGFPWGANVIAGHPGETPESLARSAAYCETLFGRHTRSTGFLSVDPYRFYPGSPIDRELASYEERYGTRVHRPRWWDYSEPSFNAGWVDPSRSLDYRTRERLTRELFGPLVRDVHRRFGYDGAAADYFRRSTEEQVDLMRDAAQLPHIRDFCLWRRLTGQSNEDARTDPEAVTLLARERRRVVDELLVGWDVSDELRSALVEEPRERYVDEEHLASAWRDVALPLPGGGPSTLSAIHAYAVNYQLLALSPGDRLLELGGGAGYGAALAARVVGETGWVRSVELDAGLSAMAREHLSRWSWAEVEVGPATWREGFNKVVFCFAVDRVDPAYLEGLPIGGRLLAPVLKADGQQSLTLWVRDADGTRSSEHDEVVYGLDRAG